MEAYTDFASVYDLCMDTVPYDEWAQAIRDRLTEYGISDGLVCELGCGTGEMTERLSQLGYDMIGIDASGDMLMEAREKLYERTEEERRDILYLLQDMREFELYGTVKSEYLTVHHHRDAVAILGFVHIMHSNLLRKGPYRKEEP